MTNSQNYAADFITISQSHGEGEGQHDLLWKIPLQIFTEHEAWQRL